MSLPTGASPVPLGGADPQATLRYPALLPRDPSTRLEPGRFVRATLTPDGPGTIELRWNRTRLSSEAWGPGAAWLEARAHALAGLDDDVSGFSPDHRALRAIWEANIGLRTGRTGTLWHDLAAIILQQRVRFVDAANSWRQLLNDLGAPAPGPHELTLPPSPDVIASLDYSAMHKYGIERSRADTLRRAARACRRIGDPQHDTERALARLGEVRGIGPWTLAGVRGMTFGDADAVPLGDVGIPSMVAWFFARERHADDDRMLELLEPWRGHRLRVVQLLFAAGVSPPRRGPKRYGVNPIRSR